MEIKQNLHPKNLSKFENDVEVHMQHIQTGLSQMGNLRVFMKAPQIPVSTQSQIQQSKSAAKVAAAPIAVRVKAEKLDDVDEADNDDDDSSSWFKRFPFPPCVYIQLLELLLIYSLPFFLF